jgi:uncharacterized protein YjbJ (UPF0337 family)
MMKRKSAGRDRAEGTVDRIAGKILEAVSALTGNRAHKAKGKAAGARGRFRSERGNVKRGHS